MMIGVASAERLIGTTATSSHVIGIAGAGAAVVIAAASDVAGDAAASGAVVIVAVVVVGNAVEEETSDDNAFKGSDMALSGQGDSRVASGDMSVTLTVAVVVSDDFS